MYVKDNVSGMGIVALLDFGHTLYIHDHTYNIHKPYSLKCSKCSCIPFFAPIFCQTSPLIDTDILLHYVTSHGTKYVFTNFRTIPFSLTQITATQHVWGRRVKCSF